MGEDIEKRKTEAEQARHYIDLAKSHRDGVWKRRATVWKAHFMLWAGIAGVVWTIHQKANINPQLWLWIACGFLGVLFFYSWYIVGSFVSDERAFRWIYWYEYQAAIRLAPGPEAERERVQVVCPVKPWLADNGLSILWAKSGKLFCVLPHFFITLAIMSGSLLLLADKVDQNKAATATASKGSRELASSATATSGTRLPNDAGIGLAGGESAAGSTLPALQSTDRTMESTDAQLESTVSEMHNTGAAFYVKSYLAPTLITILVFVGSIMVVALLKPIMIRRYGIVILGVIVGALLLMVLILQCPDCIVVPLRTTAAKWSGLRYGQRYMMGIPLGILATMMAVVIARLWHRSMMRSAQDVPTISPHDAHPNRTKSNKS